MGMLATCAYILTMDTFGPIVDNAGGIVEMSGEEEITKTRCARMDAAGNTTKALTKGYAVGSAALSAFLLFSAYMDEIAVLTGRAFTAVNLANVTVFVGALLGAMLVFLFSALAIRAVGLTAQYIIQDVRRQFQEEGILLGTVKPDYASCVDITTKGALKNMVLPGAIAVIFPVFVGSVLKYEAMAAFLMVATITGVLLALVMNSGGGAWDNAKKYVELGKYGGKGSEAHKAAIVGDTVGDPFKDTAGPSLHVLIKLLATLTLVLAPLYI
jgi:K(+)-stimulated pyrophosphate-energized sodium pump